MNVGHQRLVHTSAGQLENVATRSFHHKTITVTSTPTLIGELVDRNFVLLHHWTTQPGIGGLPPEAGALIFIGNDQVTHAGADDKTPTANTGMPVEEGLYPSLHIPEGKLYAVCRPGVTKILTFIEAF